MVEQPEGTNASGRRPLRILLFTTDFLPEPGGVQTHIFLFAAGLAKEGHQPTVVTESPAAGFDDATLPFPVLRQVGLIRLFRLIASADVIHLAGPPFIPLLVASLLGKPLVIEHHGYHAICPNGLLLYEPDRSACPGHFMRREYGECLRCVATNQSSLRSLWQLLLTFPRRWLCRRGAGFNVTVSGHVQKRLELPRSLPIYHGVPDTFAQNQPLVSISSAPLCFAYVGRLVTEKGLPVLVEAAGRLQKLGYDFRLKFVGDGPERGRLERMVAEQQLSARVIFTGFLSGEQLDQATQDAAVVVMPSIMEETAGLAAMEQMMRARLVIASDIGGLGEIVDGAGLKFAAGDVGQLTTCMARILDQPELINEIGQRARHRSLELFTEARKTETYLALYLRLLRLLGVATERLALDNPTDEQRAETRIDKNPPLNLLMFTHDWAPSVGGVQTVYMRLAAKLSAWPNAHPGQAVNVKLVTQTPADGMKDSELTFQVVRRPHFWELIHHIRAADVVHIGGPALLPLAIAWFLRKPTVLEHHGYQCICPNGLLLHEPDGSVCPGHFMMGNYRQCLRCNSANTGAARGLWNLVLTFPRRWLAAKATVNVAPSRHIGQRVALPRTRLIRHGIPASMVPPRPSARSGNELGCFAYVGRLVREKGIPVFFRASQQLIQNGYDIRMRIIGDGSERADLERIAAELNLENRTEFLGLIDREKIDNLLEEADAIVIPSICEDVAPLVAIEQMMQGRLIIASDIGGLGELIDGTGLKFPPGDSNGLASCMRQVLEAPGLGQQLGEKAQRRAAQVHTEEHMMEEHMRLYEGLRQRP